VLKGDHETVNGMRIPLLERGRPSSYRKGNRKIQGEKNEQTLYLPVVQI